MMLLVFDIKTRPVPQARPRFFSRCKRCRIKHLPSVCEKCTRHTVAYDQEKSKQFKELVAWHARMEATRQGLQEPVNSPISVELIFRMGKNGKQRFHTKRPDIDNLAKAIKDALRGIVYHDDCQIVEAHLYKEYGEEEIKIKINTLED